jgi:hypothetical protein
MSGLPPHPLSAITRRSKVPLTLPLFVFKPFGTGTADRFPFPPNAASVDAKSIVDANVVASFADIIQWKSETASELKDKTCGIVLLVNADNVQEVVEQRVPIGLFVAIVWN